MNFFNNNRNYNKEITTVKSYYNKILLGVMVYFVIFSAILLYLFHRNFTYFSDGSERPSSIFSTILQTIVYVLYAAVFYMLFTMCRNYDTGAVLAIIITSVFLFFDVIICSFSYNPSNAFTIMLTFAVFSIAAIFLHEKINYASLLDEQAGREAREIIMKEINQKDYKKWKFIILGLFAAIIMCLLILDEIIK